MPSTVSVESLGTTSFGTYTIPVKELNSRCIQRYVADYTGGDWNPSNSYAWLPGGFVDFTPKKSDSRIYFYSRIPRAWVNATHGISHWKFYVNGTLTFMHSESGNHLEEGNTFKWVVPSWGTFNARIGYQMRAYAVNNHTIRAYSTNYWDGVGSRQNAFGNLTVEEWAGVAGPEDRGGAGRTYTIR
jgi:hypothetical protein